MLKKAIAQNEAVTAVDKKITVRLRRKKYLKLIMCDSYGLEVYEGSAEFFTCAEPCVVNFITGV